jgi:hypothetical protein
MTLELWFAAILFDAQSGMLPNCGGIVFGGNVTMVHPRVRNDWAWFAPSENLRRLAVSSWVKGVGWTD